jgi:hypothetical protein
MPMTHEECRNRICIICFQKAKELRRVTVQQFHLIHQLSGRDFNPDDPRIPTVMCGTCRHSLRRAENCGSALRTFDFTSVRLHPFTRAHPEAACDCTICTTARATINFTPIAPRRKSPGRPSTPSEAGAPQQHVTICSSCWSPIGPGKSHSCSKTSKMQNAHALVNASSPEFSERLAADIVLQKVRAAGDSAAAEVTLASSSGRPVRLSVNPVPVVTSPVLTAASVRDLQTGLGLSTRKTKMAVRDLRASLGRSAVQNNISRDLHEMDHELTDLFEVRNPAVCKRGRRQNRTG